MASGASGSSGGVLTGNAGEYISIAGLRVDGRRSHEVRRVRARFGLFQRVDGSAYYEQGNTKVIAVVYGPRELKSQGLAAGAAGMSSNNSATGSSNQGQPRAVVNCEFTQAAFATSERKAVRFGGGDRKKTENSLALKQIFEACILTNLYPRSQIDIFVQILHADGGELAASVNAVTLALINAGIALSDFVVACSAGYLQQTLLCDLNYMEETARAPQLNIAMNPRTKKLSFVQLECKLPLEIFESLMESAMEGCHAIHEILQSAVRENTWKQLRTRHGGVGGALTA